MSFNITLEGGTSLRLPTAGKYCDRDIIVTAEGGKEDLDAVLTEQEGLIVTLQETLKGKASGGVDLGGLTKYTKLIAKPTERASFVIANPLGGIAKKVSVQKTTPVTSSRRCQKYLADFDLGLGVGEYADTGSKVLYTATKTEGTVNNGEFKMAEGTITLYRFNAANTWDDTAEYEVEIWQ